MRIPRRRRRRKKNSSDQKNLFKKKNCKNHGENDYNEIRTNKQQVFNDLSCLMFSDSMNSLGYQMKHNQKKHFFFYQKPHQTAMMTVQMCDLSETFDRKKNNKTKQKAIHDPQFFSSTSLKYVVMPIVLAKLICGPY